MVGVDHCCPACCCDDASTEIDGFAKTDAVGESAGDGTGDRPEDDHDGTDGGRLRGRETVAGAKERCAPESCEGDHGADEAALREEDEPGVAISEDSLEAFEELPDFDVVTLDCDGSETAV